MNLNPLSSAGNACHSGTAKMLGRADLPDFSLLAETNYQYNIIAIISCAVSNGVGIMADVSMVIKPISVFILLST